MNADVAIIKVNPAVDALGSLNKDMALNAIRMNVYKEGREAAKEKSGKLLRVLFGQTSVGINSSRTILITRMLFGIVMILGGFMIGSELGNKYCAASVIGVVTGFMLLPGILTRVSLIISSLYMGYFALTGLVAGNIEMIEMIMASGSLIFALIGPGRFSADAILRRNIFRMVRRRETHNLMERRFSYKAMQYADI